MGLGKTEYKEKWKEEMQEREEWVGKRGRREEKGEEGRQKKLGRGEGRAEENKQQKARGKTKRKRKYKFSDLLHPQIIFSINPHMSTPQNKCSVEIPEQYWCNKVPCKVVPSNLSHLKRTIRDYLVKFE